jgi:multidrug efflux pump subunit AcrA (membrane-fusion protein)
MEGGEAQEARDTGRGRLREAEAQGRVAALQRERLQRLRTEDAISEEELDRAEAEHAARTAGMEARPAEFAKARREVERCDVRAPRTGVITARHQSIGDFVQPGAALLTLVAPEDVELRAEITTGRAASLETAETIEFRAAGRVHPLDRPRRIGVVDAETGTEEFRFAFTGTPPLPGQSGRIHWRSPRTAVPADLPVRRGDRLGLFIAEEGRARFHPLPDAVEGRPARTDLPPDTAVLIEGRHAAVDGTPIEIIE